MLKIKHIKHTEIDLKKWDNCISNSVNGIVYAYSWYLDIVSENWEALITEDYSIVMPLTQNKKFGVHYLFQPHFTQQLGVFSTLVLEPEIVSKFIDAIPQKFKFYEINLNTYNKLDENIEKSTRITYMLDLIQPYKRIEVNFSQNTKRNIKKANSSKIKLINGIQINDLITLFKNNIGKTLKGLKPEHFDNIKRIMSSAIRYKIGEIYGVFDEKNTLCAAAFFITSHNKSIFLFSATNEAAKENGAMFLIINNFIEKHSETNITLDFEGSNIEGLARFYESFGAKSYEYYRIKKNKLAWYYKLLKH
jgi:cell fate (sporulation/competence/biofilm development) regulator YmcA (YheA/YmcA/DUF963 family)